MTGRDRRDHRQRPRARSVAPPFERARVGVHVVDAGPRGVDLASALRTLRALGVGSLLVEGGGRVITSFFAEKLVDRLVVGIAPAIMGAGIDAVGDLGVASVAESVRLTNRSVHQAGGRPARRSGRHLN